ncbi:MAG: hypothetical protein IPH28_22635 [Cytophagaceae bacterium]|nr:hypothetical protein [Cytophagaceae bacterium]
MSIPKLPAVKLDVGVGTPGMAVRRLLVGSVISGRVADPDPWRHPRD